METTSDFHLDFDLDEYTSFRGEQFARLLARPAIRSQIESVFAEAPGLMAPAACYDVFTIEKYLHDRVRLAGGVLLGGGPLVEVVGGAEALAVAVVTVGPAVDDRLKQMQEANQRFQALVLDELASWAVDQVRRQLYDLLCAAFAARGWRTSTFLSPGESAWSVRDQRTIFRLVEAGAIGVSLSPGFVMTPIKSLSLICGAGSQPLGVEGLTNCDFCSIRDRCEFSRSGGHGRLPMPA